MGTIKVRVKFWVLEPWSLTKVMICQMNGKCFNVSKHWVYQNMSWDNSLQLMKFKREEAATGGVLKNSCSQKISQNSQKKTCARCFCEFCEIFKNISFTEHLLTTAWSSYLKVVSKKAILKIFAKFTGKHLCQSVFFNKIAIANLFKKWLWYKCFF